MKKIYTILVCLLVMPAICFAGEKKPTLIADVWTMTPKAGHESAFYSALKEHVKFRAEKNDPRVWEVYSPVTGDNVNSYIIRACCFEWSTQDTYAEWSESSGVQKHWSETGGQHVESYNHDFIKLDNKNSNWIEGTSTNYVGVTRFNMKSGKSKAVNEAIEKFGEIAQDNKWPHSYAWSYPVTGSADVNIAVPFDNFAAMAPLDENFFKFVSRILKSEKKAQKLFDGFSNNIESSSYTIYKQLTEFSMKEK